MHNAQKNTQIFLQIDKKHIQGKKVVETIYITLYNVYTRYVMNVEQEELE